ncbi:MAG: NADH:flavin oxidoreductase [Planctomycetota bacterium]|nr:NADH:flavin oxidoreductase [Planctomycetota bacterium]
MARYYKYRSPEELEAGARSLGLDIPTSQDLSVLLSPCQVGDRTAKNRMVVQPMEGCDGTLDGAPDELTVRRYQRFGDGGAAVIWAEATAVAENARMNPRQLWLAEHTQNAIGEMIETCRRSHRAANGTTEGLLVGLQLTHSGRYSYLRPQLAVHDPVLDPLTTDRSTGQPIGDDWPLLSDDDLKRIEDEYVDAARRAATIGVDFVDIKQCHRYLLSELLAARNREGLYGGSLENRTRLVRNVIGRIRDELPDLLVVTRMNAYDGIPYQGQGEDFVGAACDHDLPLSTAFGTSPHDHLDLALEEPCQVAAMLAELGIAMINVSAGNPYSNPHVVRPAEFPPVDGYHAPEHPLVGVHRQFRLAQAIQQAVPGVPVVGSGYSWLQDFVPHAAAANITNGSVTLFGLGRGTLSHPDFARALAETGQFNRKQICRTFSYCTNLMRTKDHPLGQFPTGCPPFDKQTYGPLWKEAEPKLTGKSE